MQSYSSRNSGINHLLMANTEVTNRFLYYNNTISANLLGYFSLIYSLLIDFAVFLVF